MTAGTGGGDGSRLAGTVRRRATTLLEDFGAPQALRLLQAWWPIILGVAVGAIALVVALRRYLLARTLRARRPVGLLLPTDTFDPTAEEITRFAASLTRTHRATKVLGTHRGHGVRIRLTTGEGGLVAYHLEGSRRMESLLRVAGYADCEHRPVDSTEATAAVATVADDDGRDGDVDRDDDDDDVRADDVEADDVAPVGGGGRGR